MQRVRAIVPDFNGADMKPLLALAAVSSTLLSAAAAFAHPGGLNSEGCHNNRKTGDYHCHRSQKKTPPATRARPKPKGEAKATGETVYYRNCSAARAAGAAPVRRGDPGYGTHLDRDRDGVGCE